MHCANNVLALQLLRGAWIQQNLPKTPEQTTVVFQPHHPIKWQQPSRRTTGITKLLARGSGRPTDIAACSDSSCLYVGVIDVQGGFIATIQLGEKPGSVKERGSECLLTIHVTLWLTIWCQVYQWKIFLEKLSLFDADIWWIPFCITL